MESDRTAYVTPGTVLHLRSGNKKDRSRQKSHEETLGPLPAREQFLILKEGDTLILTDDQIAGRPAQVDEEGKLISPARIGCTLPAVFSDVRMGESIWFDDGKIGGVI